MFSREMLSTLLQGMQQSWEAATAMLLSSFGTRLTEKDIKGSRKKYRSVSEMLIT